MTVAGGLATRLAAGSRRLRDSLPAIVQITVTAVAAYAFAGYVLGHEQPLIAAIANAAFADTSLATASVSASATPYCRRPAPSACSRPSSR